MRIVDFTSACWDDVNSYCELSSYDVVVCCLDDVNSYCELSSYDVVVCCLDKMPLWWTVLFYVFS